MVNLSATTWVVLFVALLVGALVLVIWFTPAGYDPRTQLALSAISIVGVTVTLLSLFMAEERDDREEIKRDIMDSVMASEQNIEQLTAMFMDADDGSLVRLYCQMHSDVPAIVQSCESQRLDRGPPTLKELQAAERVLASIQNVAAFGDEQISRSIDLNSSESEIALAVEEYWQNNPGFEGYIPLFRMWMLSPILRTVWEDSSQFYSQDMRRFMNVVVLSEEQERP